MTLAICVVIAVLLLYQGRAATSLTDSKPWKAAFIVVALVQALAASAVLWAALSPGEPAEETELVGPESGLDLGSSPGVLRLFATRMGDAAEKRHTATTVYLAAEAGSTRHAFEVRFQFGEATTKVDEYSEGAHELLSLNVLIPALPEDATLVVRSFKPPGVMTIAAAYYPDPWPVDMLLWLALGLVLVASMLEGAGTLSYRRTFFTATTAGVATFAWACRLGLAETEGLWTLAARAGYGVAAAAVIGTLLPMLTQKFLPPLPTNRTENGV